ncbi:beta strand repeat-containing protein [Lactococcus nasutitermitis]|uniref:Beta strand repeat-containing protein n=1 Tax=Lactococcus nasutitermitis TaxID=1652957 RepID=A0ABV9JC93_9LACT|nr:LPXTG cell wall anchor domain-containing protein [Lactococcus nasutitermitis]
MFKKEKGFRSWKAGKHWLYSGGVLAVLVGGGMVYQAVAQPITVQAATLASGDSLLGNINGTIPVIKSSTTDTSSPAFQKTVDSLTQGLSPQPQYLVTDLEWGSNTKLVAASSGNIVPLSSWTGNTGNGDYSLFSPNGTNESLYADGFSPDDSSVNLPIDGTGSAIIQNVGTATDLSTKQTITLDMQVTLNSVNLLEPATSLGAIFSAHNVGSTISLGVTPLQTGGTSGDISNEGGNNGSSGVGGVGLGLGYMNNVSYTVTLRNHDTGEILPSDTLMAMKVSDIDGYQLADTNTNGFIGAVVAPNTGLSINGTGFSYNGEKTTIADGKTLLPNAYYAIKQFNANNVIFTDQSGLGDPNEGKHVDIVADLFGAVQFKLNVQQLVKNTLTKTENSASNPTGVSQAGAVFKLKNENTGDFVKASDGGDGEASIGASNGTMSTASDGALAFTTGSDGKVGVENLPSVDDNGKTITYQWVEVTAPDGEAISGSGSGQEFSAKSSTPADSDGNIPTAGTSISDKPLLESQLNKNSTNAAFNNALGDATYEAYNSDGTAITTDDGLDPATGKAADVDVVTGTLVGNDGGASGDGNPLIVTANAQGQIDVKNLDGTHVSKEITWKEVAPAAGHASNSQAATGTFSATTLNSDKSNFLATSTTTDKPMGETVIAKLDADTGNTTTQGAATLQGAEFTLEDATGAPIKQSQGVDPQTGAAANVVLTSGTTYAPDANGNIVLVTNDKGVAGQVENLDLTNNLNYQWVETKAPYGYTINDKPDAVTFSATNTVDTATNNYEDNQKLKATISDRVVDFNFSFTKDAADQGATGLNGAEFTLTPLAGTQNSLGQFDNGKDTNINGQDTYISPDTGLATPVTDVSQLFLGATQTSHDYTDPQGNQSAGWVEYDHVQAGKYKLAETTTPKGYAPVDDMEVDILPDTDTTGAPTSYELKVTDTVTGNVLRDETIPVAYSTSQSGRQLIDDNNSLGKFNLGQLIDKLPVPSIDVEKTNDTVPDAGKGNDTDVDNNAGPNDHDTVASADVVKAGDTTTIDFRITNNGTDDLTKVTAKDKTTSGSVDIGAITWTYNGQTVSLNKDGYFVNSDGTVLALPVGQSITGTATLPALPAGQLHTDQIAVSGIGIQSGGDVQDHDNWNGETPKPSIDIEKANGAIPKAGKGNNTDTANNDGTNDHDTAATADKVKNKVTTAIYFNGTNNGTEPLTDIKVVDKTTAGSVSVGAITWTYKGQTLKTNADGYLTLQDGTLLTLAPNENITGTGLLPALPAGELHTDNVTIQGVGTLDKVPVGDNDNWNGITPLTVKTTAHTTGTSQTFTPSASTEMYDTVETNAPKGDIQVAYLHKITPDGKDTIVATVPFTINDATVEAEKDTVLKSIDTTKDVAGTRYVWGEAIFAKGADTKTDKPLATFYDKNDKAETLTYTPLTLKTTAHTTGTSQSFTPSTSTTMYDDVETNTPKGDIQEAYLHKITPDGKDTIVATVPFTINDATVEAKKDTVLKSIDTSKDVAGTRYVWGEALFDKGADIKTAKPLATFYDKNDKAETLTLVTTPVALTPVKPNLTIILPDTGTKALAWLTGIGVAILAAVGGTTLYKKRKKGSDKAK